MKKKTKEINENSPIYVQSKKIKHFMKEKNENKERLKINEIKYCQRHPKEKYLSKTNM